MLLSYETHLPPGEYQQNLPPLILLHGMLDSSKTWTRIAPALARNTGRKVFCLDARNHGLSPRTQDHSFDLVAEDVIDWMDRMHIRKAVLVGHSMGGRAAATVALRTPERVEKLVVEDMVLREFRPDQSGGFLMLMDALEDALPLIPAGISEREGRESVKELIAQGMGSMGDPSNFDLFLTTLVKRSGEWAWQANFPALRAFLTTDLIRQRLKGVYMGDTLFLYGTKSFFKVDRERLIPLFFPKSVRIPFPGASHMIHFEFPDDFTATVSAFVNGTKSKL